MSFTSCSDRPLHQILSEDPRSSFFGFRDTFTLLSILKRKSGRLTDQHAVLVCPVKFLNQLIFLRNFNESDAI